MAGNSKPMGKSPSEAVRLLWDEWHSLNGERMEYRGALTKLRGINTELNSQLLSLSRSVNDALTVKIEEVQNPEAKGQNDFLSKTPKEQEEVIKKLNEKLNNRSKVLEQLKKQIVSQQNTNIALEKKLGVSSNVWVLKELGERLAQRREDLEATKREKKLLEGKIVFADKELLSLQRRADEGPNGWQKYESELNILREQLRTVYHKRQGDMKTLNEQYGEMERNEQLLNAFLKLAEEKRGENPGPFENLGEEPTGLDVTDSYLQMRKDERKIHAAIKKAEETGSEKRNVVKKMEERLKSSARVLVRDLEKLKAKLNQDTEKQEAVQARVEKFKKSDNASVSQEKLDKLMGLLDGKSEDLTKALEQFSEEVQGMATKYLGDETATSAAEET